MIRDIKFSKYKRFFAFGCSFTGYWWPTWADVLSKEMPQASFYNMGVSGAGNLLISAKIVEANLKFNFTEGDLVIVMWSTFCREDRYYKNAWDSPGNIFTQNTYSTDFVKKFADPKGYLIRDLTLMDLSTNYQKDLPCDDVTLMSVPFNYQNETNPSVIPIIDSFSDLVTNTPPSMYDLELNGVFENGHEYYNESTKKQVQDYHPNPVRYRNYLEKLKFPLTDKSLQYANKSFEILKSTKNVAEIKSNFVNNQGGNYYFNQWW
jgi:hypothetical protein